MFYSNPAMILKFLQEHHLQKQKHLTGMVVQVVWSSVVPSEKVEILSVILGHQHKTKCTSIS